MIASGKAPSIAFDDGAAYEHSMGEWSRLVGERFLDWLDPAEGLRWLDVGCGNGAFTELLVQRCAPSVVHGVDPSAGQLAFAHKRDPSRSAVFVQGDAMSLPYRDGQFDAVTMALVVVFVPAPRRGMFEMARMLRPGGTVAAYVWDMPGGGFPLEPVLSELLDLGWRHGAPPHASMARMPALLALWADAGLEDVRAHEIGVGRRFATFDDFWQSAASSSTVAPALACRTTAEVERLRERVHRRVLADREERIVIRARAHAIQGRKAN